jgi:hypothetical protein
LKAAILEFFMFARQDEAIEGERPKTLGTM